jgi:hypothetical protein
MFQVNYSSVLKINLTTAKTNSDVAVGNTKTRHYFAQEKSGWVLNNFGCIRGTKFLQEEDENINLSNVTETDGNFWDSNTSTNSNQNDIIMDENCNKDEECKDDEININKRNRRD